MSGPINVVVPMAGEGRRFRDAGYQKPKPFILVKNRPMVSHVLENLQCPDANYILVARQEHMFADPEAVALLSENYDAKFIQVPALTEGTACTVLTCRDLIDNDRPLVIANSDQIVDFDFKEFIRDAQERSLDGSILTFQDIEKNPKWSFAKTDSAGFVTEVKEKSPISDRATVGIYYFKEGRAFVRAALRMIEANDRVNGEFYTCPVYNYLLKDQAKVGIFDVPAAAMHGIGTPEDLDTYLGKIHS